MTIPAPKAAVNWSAAGVLLTASVMAAGVVGWLSPLRGVPDDIKAMKSKAEENTLETKVSITKLDATLTTLNRTVNDLSDSLKEVRLLSSRFDQFKNKTESDIQDLRRQVDKR